MALEQQDKEQPLAPAPPSQRPPPGKESPALAGHKRSADALVDGGGLGVLAAQIEVFSQLGGLEPEAQRARVVASLSAQRVPPRKPRVGPDYQATNLPEPKPIQRK